MQVGSAFEYYWMRFPSLRPGGKLEVGAEIIQTIAVRLRIKKMAMASYSVIGIGRKMEVNVVNKKNWTRLPSLRYVD